MQGSTVIRYLDHTGNYLYYFGTDNTGGALFGSIEDARFFGDARQVEKIEVLCRGQDFDVEVVPYRDSMRVV